MQLESFDTHTLYQSLIDSGMPQDQANAVIKCMAALHQFGTATKQDIKELENSVEKRFREVDRRFDEMEKRIIELKGELKSEIKADKNDLLKWMFAMQGSFAALIVALIKLL